MGTTPVDDGWVGAGVAWGHAATDWAYLFEPYARDAAEHIFDQTNVGPGTDLFDMACGSGLATGRAARLGSNTTGLDASAELIAIAERRNPAGAHDVGTMFALPYADASFDVVTSFNGIWGGCDEAMTEAFRVLRPGGQLGITFWGPGKSLGFRDMFIALGGIGEETKGEMIGMASIGTPGVVEQMFSAAGFELTQRGETEAVLEFRDDKTAWRCLRSPGLMRPALDKIGDTALRNVLMPTIDPFRAADGSYRILNGLTHVIGTKPE